MVKYLVFVGLIIIGGFSPLVALDFQTIDTRNEAGELLQIDKIKILSVLRIFNNDRNGSDLLELSGLAWSEDENILYAISDRGALFHFSPTFNATGLSDLKLLNSSHLLDQAGNALEYPWADSEGLAITNQQNGRQGDDELLVSFELKPRLQWHRPNGSFIKKQKLPEWLEKKSNYASRNKALESVVIHPEYGVLTASEYPTEKANWQTLTLYQSNGGELSIPRKAEEDMAVCAIEVMPDDSLMLLKRRHAIWGPMWTSQLEKLQLKQGEIVGREILATLKVGDVLPVDNFEGLTHHKRNRYFMVSDDNDHFVQQTLLVYFEVLP